MPFNTPIHTVANIIREANADSLIATAGSLSLEILIQSYPGVKHVIWVAERSSRQMGWNEVPEGVGGRAEIAVWHEILEENRDSASADLPSKTSDAVTPNIFTVTISTSDPKKFELIEFTQAVSHALCR